MKKLTWGIGAVLVAALVLGCGLRSSPRPPLQENSSPVESPSPSASPSPSVEPTVVVLEDGRHPVFITSIDVPGRKITFDLLIFVTGEQAKKEWKIDHPGDPGSLDTDYYIVNRNPKLRTLPVALDVQVTVVTGALPTNTPLTFGLLSSHFSGNFDSHMFWLTVTGGQVVRIDEQYLP